MRAKKVMRDVFYIYIKRQGKKASYCTLESFDNLKDAIKCAMSHKDRTNTVYVKQAWYNTTGNTGEITVFECVGGNGNGYIRFNGGNDNEKK